MIKCVCFEYFYAIIGKLLKQCLELSRKLNLELLSKYFEKKWKYLEILKTIFGIIEKIFGVIEKIFGKIGKILKKYLELVG